MRTVTLEAHNKAEGVRTILALVGENGRVVVAGKPGSGISDLAVWLVREFTALHGPADAQTTTWSGDDGSVAVRSGKAGCLLLGSNWTRDERSRGCVLGQEASGLVVAIHNHADSLEDAAATLAGDLRERGCADVTPETLERTLVLAHIRRDRDKAVVTLAGPIAHAGVPDADAPGERLH